MRELYDIKKRRILLILLLFISLIFLFNVNALIAYPDASNNLNIQSCILENNSVPKNNYSVACVGIYPSTCSTNDELGCDDAKEENASYTINHFGGVYIQVGNTSINNCGSIGDVFLCYKWKTSGGTSTDCLVAVDANGNASWTNVSTACPGTSEPASATCVNVTANESWTCNSFFDTIGTKAVARNEISRSNGGMSRLANDVLFFNITWYVETVKPSEINLINPANQTINASASWTFSSNVSDNVRLANATLYTNISGSWIRNQTNTTIGSGNITTFTINNVQDGGYIWNVEWCDTSNNCAQANSNNTFTVNNPPYGINFLNPPDNTNNISNTHYFISSAADNRSLANATLYTNISGSWNADQITDLTGMTNTTNFAVYNITSGGYIWNVEWCDTDNICSQAASNFTFIVNSTLNNSSNNSTNSSNSTTGSGGAGSGSGANSGGGVDSGERANKLAAAQSAQASRNTFSPVSNPAPSPTPAPSSATAVTGAASSIPTGNVVNELGEKTTIANKTIAKIIIGSIIGLLLVIVAYIIRQMYLKRKALKGRNKK